MNKQSKTTLLKCTSRDGAFRETWLKANKFLKEDVFNDKTCSKILYDVHTCSGKGAFQQNKFPKETLAHKSTINQRTPSF